MSARVETLRRTVTLALVFAPLLAGCGRTQAPAAAAPAPVEVKVVAVTRGSIGRTIALPAEVRPHAQAVLYAKVAGYLKTILVDKGDRVRAGELLAELESPELVADLVRQEAELAVAEVAYRRASEAQKKAPDLVMPQTVDDAKGKRDVAKASRDRTHTLLSYTKIRAPLSGIVTRRSVDPGAFIPAATAGSVAQSAALLTVMDIRSVRIEIAVPEPEVPFVKIGLPVEVVVDELPGRSFPGRVTRFAYALDEASKTMTAEAELENPGDALRPGMYARAKLTIEQRPDALLVPAAAVVGGKGQDYVLTVSAGRAKRIAVKTGFRDEARVEIRAGLDPGQGVILVGANPPADGQPVKVGEGR